VESFLDLSAIYLSALLPKRLLPLIRPAV
jgi:hypothetical protein